MNLVKKRDPITHTTVTQLYAHTHPLWTIKQIIHLGQCADSSLNVALYAEQLQVAC